MEFVPLEGTTAEVVGEVVYIQEMKQKNKLRTKEVEGFAEGENYSGISDIPSRWIGWRPRMRLETSPTSKKISTKDRRPCLNRF